MHCTRDGHPSLDGWTGPETDSSGLASFFLLPRLLCPLPPFLTSLRSASRAAGDRHGPAAALDVGSCRRRRHRRCCCCGCGCGGGGPGEEAAGGHDSRPGRRVDEGSVPRREPAGVPPPPRLRCGRPWLAAPVRGRRLVQRRAVVHPKSRHAARVHPAHEQARGLLRRARQRSGQEPRFLQLESCEAAVLRRRLLRGRFRVQKWLFSHLHERPKDMGCYHRRSPHQRPRQSRQGCSAGGLATFFHCDDLGELLGGAATVKCMSDAGFFLDVDDISGNNSIRPFFSSLVALQGAEKNLNKGCLNSTLDPYLCFFPQYALQNIETPYFILNSAYDAYQFHHIFVPPSSDPRGHWSRCKADPSACSTSQIATLQGLRSAMLTALKPFEGEPEMGMFINSCFAHCQSELQDTWFAPNSPTLDNETIAELVGDWYFERGAAQEIDCAYPCDSTCHNIIPI